MTALADWLFARLIPDWLFDLAVKAAAALFLRFTRLDEDD